MKFKKIIIYSIGFLVLVTLILGYLGVRKFNKTWFADKPNYLEITSDLNAIEFDWSEGEYGGYLERHEAIFIPGQIKGLPIQLNFQFDTGSRNTLLYENTLQSLKISGLDYEVIKKDGSEFVEELFLEFGGSKIRAKMIKIYKGYGKGIEKKDSIDGIILGTIGADFLEEYITEINFKDQTIQFYEKRQEWMTENTSFESFSFEGRRMMLPCKIDWKSLELFYDSGSSAFGLITSKQRYKMYSSSDTKELHLSANNWGNSFPIYHKATNKEMEIGGEALSIQRISYVDMYGNLQWIMTPFTRIGGWLGNKPFIKCSLIFDTSKEEFLVLRK